MPKIFEYFGFIFYFDKLVKFFVMKQSVRSTNIKKKL